MAVAVAGSRRKTPGWAGVGPQGRWAVFFTGLTWQGEEGEMGGLHRELGPKLKMNRNYNFEFLVAGLNGFKRTFEFG
jgi:hypothetical protein